MSRKDSRVLVLLSHDVEWGRSGAPISHILARKERFSRKVLENLDSRNPYQNIPEMLDIEERFGLRSTFFFRTYVQDSQHPPPPYDLTEYKSDIRTMLAKDWEVGLHSDMTSHNSLESLRKEKEELETVTGNQVLGNRVHYTLGKALNTPLFQNLNRLGFKYDSSVKYQREDISARDFGYLSKRGVIVFPITIMDALIFHYNVKSEADVLKIVKHAIITCERMRRKHRILTIDWHDCSLQMRYGRKYPEVLKYLVSKKNLQVKRGIDLANMLEGELQDKREKGR